MAFLISNAFVVKLKVLTDLSTPHTLASVTQERLEQPFCTNTTAAPPKTHQQMQNPCECVVYHPYIN
jgi:hypothetical protein